ncbi:DUF4167 domain-containing protein [Sphingomonas sp. AOB5]|uniref:DUF4167 domain-containing protein n=1 Tax=Sphingomonas sp. AOB5 TaxID=3034017 RepID=UPI0023F843E8|nr:DUF4167 domain-containing protein [Sphingomonas sp. AOB5]MDF7774752.1 DUF4167 domain-containing protein [Sphingomonas sp. AOB5]
MNNRQANGRRRGRGGQQQRSGGGQGGQRDNGNRIDNRARGNAAQLLEKYKNLARDAQMQGDRVNTEYYLQFADHYFRVLAETRSRFEENNPGQQQPRHQNGTDDFADDFGFEAEGDRDDQPRGDEGGQREDRDHRGNREDRDNRGNGREARGDREGRGNRDTGRDNSRDNGRDGGREDRGNREERASREDRDDRRNGRANGNGHYNGDEAEAPEVQAEEAPRAPRRGLRTRRDREAAPEAEASHGIDAAILPPALGIDTGASEEAPVEEKPKRRGRPRRDAEVAAE